MGKCIMMIGLPSSGKSTYAKKNLMNDNTLYLSSDALRVEMYGFEDQMHNGEVFNELHNRLKKALKEGKDVIYDATNANRKKRMEFIKDIRGEYEVEAIMACCPIATILERNITRVERHLPFDKLEHLIKFFEVPLEYEGFSKISLVNCGCKVGEYDNNSSIYETIKNYNQNNPHHNKSLLGHTEEVINQLYVLGLKNIHAYDLGWFHDLGKLYTRANKEDGTSSYYGHERVSAYMYFCYSSSFNEAVSKDDLTIALLISHHMAFYQNIETIKEIVGDANFELLKILHKADKFRSDL